jgi:hypothetical protein
MFACGVDRAAVECQDPHAAGANEDHLDALAQDWAGGVVLVTREDPVADDELLDRLAAVGRPQVGAAREAGS